MLFNPIFFGAEPTLLRFTQQFDNAYWKTNLPPSTNSASITVNTIIAPDGTLTSDKLYVTGTPSNSVCLIYDNEIRVIAGQTYTISIYAKAGTSGFLQICGRSARFGFEVYANFDLVNGIVTKVGTDTLAKIQLDNNGWYRCAISGVAIARGTGAIAIGIVELATSSRQNRAIAGNGVYIWGVKIQTGTIATDYKNEFTQVVYSGASPIDTNRIPLVAIGFGTDLHNSDLDPYVNNYPRDGAAKLQDAVNFWNTKSLDFVVMNGDYTDGGFSGTSKILTESEQIAEISEVETVFNSCLFPRKHTLGNHDMDSLDKALNIANIASLTAAYYYYDINGIRFIHLDANYMFDTDVSDYDRRNWRSNSPVTQYINPAQRTWLTSTLSTTTNNVIIFCHQGLHSDVNNLNVTNASVVRGILEASGKVVAVFTGHEHVNLLTVINKIPYYSMKAMTSDAYPGNAYSVIKLFDKSVKVDGYVNQSSYPEFYFSNHITIPSYYDTDASNFLYAALIGSPIHQSAINDLVVDLKTASIWTKMKAIYPIVGGDSFSHKFNLKNPLDTDAAFRLQFVGGITHSATGMLPNGTTGYAKTFLTPSVTLTDRNHAIGVYVRSIGIKDSSFRATMGSNNNTTNVNLYIEAYYQGKAITRNASGASAFIQNTNANSIGLLVSTNLAGTCRFTLNGGSVVSATQDKGSADISYPIAVGGFNRGGTYEGLCNDEIAFAFISDNLTNTETTDLYTIIQSFQTKLNRQV